MYGVKALSCARNLLKFPSRWLIRSAVRRGRVRSFSTVSMATKLFSEGFLDQSERHVSTGAPFLDNEVLDNNTFDKVCEETLDSLSEYFEELIEVAPHLKSADVSYGSGVLTVNFGKPFGTYVINRQSPNKQIWLSSPISGPKRYDFVVNGNYWIYKHDGMTLHQLLQNEIPKIVKKEVDFSKCSFSKLN